MLRAVTSWTIYLSWSVSGACFVRNVSLELACGHRLTRRGSRVPQRARCPSCKEPL